MSSAKFIRKLDGWRGDARLYRLSKPITDTRVERYAYHEVERSWEYVVVSAAHAPFTGPETYIFAANEAGECPDMLELPGSFRGSRDHSLALANAGYDLEPNAS